MALRTLGGGSFQDHRRTETLPAQLRWSYTQMKSNHSQTKTPAGLCIVCVHWSLQNMAVSAMLENPNGQTASMNPENVTFIE